MSGPARRLGHEAGARLTIARRELAGLPRRRAPRHPRAPGDAATFASNIRRRWGVRGQRQSSPLGLDLRGTRRLPAQGPWSLSFVLHAHRHALRPHASPSASVPTPLPSPASAGVRGALMRAPGHAPASRVGGGPARGQRPLPSVSSPPAPALSVRSAGAAAPWPAPPRLPSHLALAPLVVRAILRRRRPSARRRLSGISGCQPLPEMASAIKPPVSPTSETERAIKPPLRPTAERGAAPTPRAAATTPPLFARRLQPFAPAVARPSPMRGDEAASFASRVTTIRWRAAFPTLTGAPRAVSGATLRGEYHLAPIALEAARPLAQDVRASGSRPDATPGPSRASDPGGRPSAEAKWAELEKAIAAKVERRLDQKITTTVREALGADTEIARAMRDGVYDALHDRMVLERERRG
jgi:hypothetical protein